MISKFQNIITITTMIEARLIYTQIVITMNMHNQKIKACLTYIQVLVASLEDHHVVDTPAWNNVSEKRELIIARRKPKISIFLVLKRKKQRSQTKVFEIEFPYKATIKISSQISPSLLSFPYQPTISFVGIPQI